MGRETAGAAIWDNRSPPAPALPAAWVAAAATLGRWRGPGAWRCPLPSTRGLSVRSVSLVKEELILIVGVAIYGKEARQLLHTSPHAQYHLGGSSFRYSPRLDVDRSKLQIKDQNPKTRPSSRLPVFDRTN